MTSLTRKTWDVLTSLKLSITCLALLMVLVVACTLAQVQLGTLGAVNAYIRSFVVWWDLPGSTRSVPILPGGALVGLVLGVNLIAAQVKRMDLSWGKSGLWLVHAGLILLVAGEFVTGLMQVDMQMAIEQGQTLNYTENTRELELAVTDTTNPQHDEVFGIPESLLARGQSIDLPGTPITLKIQRYLKNAELGRRAPDAAPIATMGVGAEVSVTPLPPVSKDNEENHAVVLLEPVAGGRHFGTWLVSNALGAPQSFIQDGHTYVLSMRARRHYLPYSVTLKKFSHDVYAGTDIPKNFSSLVHLSNPAQHEERDVLIFMNQPLRYDGKAFYQASFGKGDTLSVLQVVQNPGWLLPYISCALVTFGLLVHFVISLRRAMRKQQRRVVVETKLADPVEA
jgi:hypothetical protein